MLERFNFSSDFQDLVLASMSRFPEKFSGIDTVLDSRYFTGTNSSATARLLLEYYKEHGTYPSLTVLGQQAARQSRKSNDGDVSYDLTEYIKKLSELECRDVDYCREQVIRFAVERALLIAATEVARLVQEGKEPSHDIVEKFQSALSLGANLQEIGYDAEEDAYKVIGQLVTPGAGINSGFDLFDNYVWKHGMRDGWLVVPLAPPKSWKTTFCLNMARHIAGPSIGENVVYYACEIDEKLALQRLYQALIQKTEEDMYMDPRAFYTELVEGMNVKLKGNIFVKHFPSKSATINDIRAHLKSLIALRGWAPRVVFIDYAETIKSSDKETAEHRISSSIYTDAKQLADEFHVTVVMPDRCNRETVEQPVPSMTSFQGAFEKAGIVDVAFGLCSTPEEYQESILRFFFFLNRHGDQYLHFKGRVDRERMTITVNQKLEYDALKALEENHANRRGRGARAGAGRQPRNVAAIQREGG